MRFFPFEEKKNKKPAKEDEEEVVVTKAKTTTTEEPATYVSLDSPRLRCCTLFHYILVKRLRPKRQQKLLQSQRKRTTPTKKILLRTSH
jgi:hypothetical protein